MNLLQQRRQDQVYVTGLALLAVSVLCYLLPSLTNTDKGALFLIHFSFVWLYFVIFMSKRKQLPAESKLHHRVLLLLLFLVSAYSLNQDVNIFGESVNWFAAVLVLVSINSMAFAFFDAMPVFIRHLLSLVNGLSTLVFTYLALYLFPLYPYGLVGFFLIGIPLHLFVPLLLLISTIMLQRRVPAGDRRYWFSYAGGIIAAGLFTGIYVFLWNKSVKQIETASQPMNGLPAWAMAAQDIPNNSFSQKILKSGMVYSQPGESPSFAAFNIRGGMNEPKKHDPLVTTAVFFNGSLRLENDECKRILETFGERHKTEDRLWTGDALQTTNVDTRVKIWAPCNISYTEKTLTVATIPGKMRWQQEAIYTFHLPEGSVVTSLSLWINEKEEKAILTSRAQADSAYRTIVGVESRDPSVVHWKEGNRVSVRVFPVTRDLPRKFKLGITSPMKTVNGKLRYENIWFEGPPSTNAKENIDIDFEEPVTGLTVPESFVSMPNRSYQRKGNYDPSWSLLLNNPTLAGCSFQFDGSVYSSAPYHRELTPASFRQVYLDLNQSWTREEYDRVLSFCRDKQVFVASNGVAKPVTAANSDDVWKQHQHKQFSLFPLFSITDPDNSLLVSKSAAQSPTLDELGGSDFIKQTRELLSKPGRIKLFNIGDELSPYLRSLREYRVFQYDDGNIDMLESLLRKNHFASDLEDDAQVIVHEAGMVLRKMPGQIAIGGGPDHLMRLFAYNHLMQKTGRGLLNNLPVGDSLVEEARKAYVVTPLSSLVVLETREDYERFNIKDGKVTLSNAAASSQGAVPEPHEWALIGLVVLAMGWLFRRAKQKNAHA